MYGNGVNGVSVYGIVGSGTWYPDLNYVATQDVVVESGNTLRMQPGTVVKLSAGHSFVVRGALVASGTLDKTIVFTSLADDRFGNDIQQDGAATKPNPGDWGALYFADTSSDANSLLDHVVLRYGGAGYSYGAGTAHAELVLDSAAPSIQNSLVERSAADGVELLNVSSPSFHANTVADNLGHGLWISPSFRPQVRQNSFVRNGANAVYVAGGSQGVFGGNTASGNKVNGIGVTGTFNTNSTWEYHLPLLSWTANSWWTRHQPHDSAGSGSQISLPPAT